MLAIDSCVIRKVLTNGVHQETFLDCQTARLEDCHAAELRAIFLAAAMRTVAIWASNLITIIIVLLISSSNA